MINFYKKLNDNIWAEWLFRIIYLLVFIETAIVLQDGYYPDLCWLMILVSTWLYFFKQKILGILPLILAVLLHIFHISSNT